MNQYQEQPFSCSPIYRNMGVMKEYRYQGNGIIVCFTTVNHEEGRIKGTVNQAGTHILASDGKSYRLKSECRADVKPGQVRYFVPATRRFRGEYWARACEAEDVSGHTLVQVSEEKFDPLPIGGGLLVAKSSTDDDGGDIRIRNVVVLWNDGKLEEFAQTWGGGKERQPCRKGQGHHLTLEQLQTSLGYEELMPFQKPETRPCWYTSR